MKIREWWKIVIIIALLAFLVVVIYGITSIELGKRNAALERHTYTGLVTAVESNESVSYVYLNSNSQKIKIYTSYLSLEIGRYYEIIIDGNGKLINARIIKQ